MLRRESTRAIIEKLGNDALQSSNAALALAVSERRKLLVQVTLRTWSDAVLSHIYQTRFLACADGGHADDENIYSEEEFIASHIAFDGTESLASLSTTMQRFARFYPVESAFVVRLLARLPEMARVADDKWLRTVEAIIPRLLAEHVAYLCDLVYERWQHEQPTWMSYSKAMVAPVTASDNSTDVSDWQQAVTRNVLRLFDTVALPKTPKSFRQ